jgi:hypothetical protein
VRPLCSQVRVFTGPGELSVAMTSLLSQPGCENAVLLVQDFVPNDLEMRAFIVQGVLVHAVYSDFDVEGCR